MDFVYTFLKMCFLTLETHFFLSIQALFQFSFLFRNIHLFSLTEHGGMFVVTNTMFLIAIVECFLFLNLFLDIFYQMLKASS